MRLLLSVRWWEVESNRGMMWFWGGEGEKSGSSPYSVVTIPVLVGERTMLEVEIQYTVFYGIMNIPT